QLLFFFVATFNPSRAEGKFAMSLPATGQPKAQDVSQVDPSKTPDPNLEVPTEFVVVVRAHDESFSVALRESEKLTEIGAVRGLTPQSRREEVLRLLDQVREKLADRLKAKRDKEGQNASENVKIEPNAKMKNAELVAVMDACVRAGYVQVGFAAPPDA